MSTIIDAIFQTWEQQKGYAARLVADLSDEDMVGQPVPGVKLNHPAWTLSHLMVYCPVLNAILLEKPFEDPISAKHGRDSEPENDINAYPRKQKLVAEYLRLHDELGATLRSVNPSILEKVTPLARWQAKFPKIAHLTLHLMIDHESLHLGQVSVWRRAGKRPRV